MKTEFLKELGLEKDAIDKIMAENGKDIEAFKRDNAVLKDQIASATANLAAANQKIAEFGDLDVEKIKQEASDWKQKAEEAQRKADEQVNAIRYEQAVSTYANGVRFTSELARKAFVAELKQKGLKLENDTLLGADDFTKQMREQNPDAFAKEKSGAPDFSNTTPPGTPANTNEQMNNLIRSAKGVSF